MVRMQSELAEAKVPEVLSTRLALLLQGTMLAASVSHTIQESLSMHLAMNAPINKRVARCIARLIELLKSIEETYSRQNVAIARTLPGIQQFVMIKLYRLVTPVRDRIAMNKRINDSVIDTLAALDLFVSALDGPATRDRIIVADLALAQAMQHKVLRDDELEDVRSALRKLEMVTTLQPRFAPPCLRAQRRCSPHSFVSPLW